MNATLIKLSVHLQHLLLNTPVWEDWLVIEMNLDGGIRQIEGTIHPYLEKQLFNRPMIPAISEKQAIKIAVASVHGDLVNEPKAALYYLSTRPGTPLIYVVNLRPFADRETITLIIISIIGKSHAEEVNRDSMTILDEG